MERSGQTEREPAAPMAPPARSARNAARQRHRSGPERRGWQRCQLRKR